MIEAAALALADLIVVVHALFLFFVLGGIILVLRWPRLWPLHASCATWGLYIEFTRFTCPLTIAEKWLRINAVGVAYTGGFFERYFATPLLRGALPRPVQTTLVFALLTLSLVGYVHLVRRGAIPVRVRSGSTG